MTKVKTKRTIKLNELTDADAEYISLVGRGANNTPFKVIKQETQDMDFSKLFKKDEKAAFVKAVVVNKSSDIEAAKARVEKAGFTVEKAQETGDVVVFSQSDDESSENQVVIKFDEDIALVVVHKYFDSWDFETDSFKELFAKQGVWPTLSAAHNTLWDVMLNIMYSDDSKDPAETASKLGTAIKEYRTFVTDMVKSLPVEAFKLEDPSLSGESQTTVKEEATMSEQEKEIEKKEDAPVQEGAEQKAEKGECEQEQAETEVSNKTDAKEGSEKESEMSELMKAIQGLTSEVKELRASVEKTGEEQSALKGRVEEIATVAKSADEALNGLTNAGAHGDRSVEKKEASKASAPLTSSAHRMGKQYFN